MTEEAREETIQRIADKIMTLNNDTYLKENKIEKEDD